MSSKRIGRREALTIMGAAGAAVAFGCGDSPTSPTTSSTSTSTNSTNAACGVTPTETVGPYPSLTDLFRSDIRESKQGTVLTLTIKVVNTNAGCVAVPNAEVEIWHVDAVGNYSQYGSQAHPDLSTWHPNHQQQRRSHLHDHLSRLVSGTRDPHSRRGHDHRRVAQGDADCVPRVGEQHGPYVGRLRVTRHQSDVERH